MQGDYMNKKAEYIHKHILIAPDIYRQLKKESDATTGGNMNLLIRDILEQYYSVKKSKK